MPVRSHQLIGQVADQQPEERDRSHQRGRHGHQRGDGRQRRQQRAAVIHAQVHGDVATQRQHVVAAAHAPQQQRHRAHDGQRHRQQLKAHRIEVGEHAVLQHQELVRIDQPDHEAGQAAEQQSEDDAHQHHQVQAAHGIREQPAEQQAGEGRHDADFQQERRHRMVRGHGRLSEGVHHQRLDQQVERVEAHDGGRQDAVVRDGLEQHRGHRHRIGHGQHGQQLAATERQDEGPAALRAQRHESRDAGDGGGGQQPQAPRLRRGAARRPVAGAARRWRRGPQA